MTSFQSEFDWIKIAEHFGFSTVYGGGIHGFMERCGYPITTSYNTKIGNRSNKENEVYEYIKSIVDCDVICNTKKVITPYELDIYIPEYNLAIEFNGLYWHSSESQDQDVNFKNKHLNKTKMCEDLGIRLIHIFENEWDDDVKRTIWKSVINTKLGLNNKIPARKTVLKDISVNDANMFCDTNHLQGRCSASFAKGLYYNDELVMVATFGKPRYNKSHDTELIRLCSKLNTTVVGGSSKITKNISFISYANRRWSNGNVYDQLNMVKVNNTSPSYFYFKLTYKAIQLHHRSKFMKHKLESVLDAFDPNLSESVNCYNNGYRRIWDCGNILYQTK